MKKVVPESLRLTFHIIEGKSVDHMKNKKKNKKY